MRSPSGGDPEKHRPLERRAALRTAVVWDAVQQVLGAPGGRIVDIGGGTGGFAVRLAEQGHQVTGEVARKLWHRSPGSTG